ncbi:mg2+ transporter zinc transport protein [Apiospora saccharicola]|uniref:Mg2+ transporter zinc transport protein n=1 Tax=Apiospora saccharicola TaxID=335842 RepID=A0ABR1VJV2_9PEZI
MVYHDIDIPLPAFIAIDWTGMTLALLPILLRFWLRYKENKAQPWTRNVSDALVVLSWLAGIVLISINAWKNMLRYWYIHYPDQSQLYYMVPRDQSAHLLYVSWVSLFFIYISLWAAKFALLAFFAGVLLPADIGGGSGGSGGASGVQFQQRGWIRVVLAGCTVFTAATFCLHMTLLTAWCRPISSNWNIDGHLCSAVHDINSVTISTVANIATDLAILSLPLIALFTKSRERRALMMTNDALQLQEQPVAVIGRAELTGVAFVVAMSALSITAALARFVTLKLVQNVPRANITHTIDVWALVEIVASLMAVSLPTLRVFVRRRRARRPGGAARR